MPFGPLIIFLEIYPNEIIKNFHNVLPMRIPGLEKKTGPNLSIHKRDWLMYICPSDKIFCSHLKQWHMEETFSGLGNAQNTVNDNAGYKTKLFSFCLSDLLNCLQ